MIARVGTAAVGIPILVFAGIADSLIPIQVLSSLLVFVICLEVASGDRTPSAVAWIGGFAFAAVIFFADLTHVHSGRAASAILGTLLVFAFAQFFVEGPLGTALRCLAWFAGGIALVRLRTYGLTETGIWSFADQSLLLLFFIATWVGDTSAMLVGRSWGRLKLAPTISPNKTWEGAVANLVGSCIIGWFFAGLGGLEPGWGIALGATVGVAGQAGDLLKSQWKRKRGLKDSGRLLPGHGGVLDRFDSMLFSAPFVLALMNLRG